MIRKALFAAALLALAGGAYATTDYPAGFTKCAKEGSTCTFSGTRSVAYGKAGTFVFATLTGPIVCSGSLFPAINVDTPRYCSFDPTDSGGSGGGGSSGGGSGGGSGSGGGGSASGGGGAVGTPIGFGSATTGGAGGAVVTAHTGTEINAALCARASVTTPLIIRVDGTINVGNTTHVTGSCDTTATEIQFKGVSNITLVGVANRGVLDQIGVHLRNTSNIIIQNLFIKNVKKSGSPVSNGGDAIGMESGVNNVWVDHNTLEADGGESDGFDSLTDMKSGVTNITESYNHYVNSSRVGLIGFSDDDAANTNITFHHNWYDSNQQRTPLLRHGLVHTFNNYWFNVSNSDMIHGINSRMSGRVLVEGNYFKNSNNPLIASDDSPQPGCWQTRANTLDSITYDRSVGHGALVVPVITNGQFDSTCTVTVPYTYTLDPSANIPAIVTANAGAGKISP